MNGIVRFVETITQLFEKHSDRLEEDQKLPPADVLEEVCQTLVDVSCLREEDRYPTFRVCFINPESELLGMYVYSHPLRFESPIPFTVPQLHKLAPALNKNMSYLVLDVSSRPIRITGIIAAFTTVEKIMTREVTIGIRMPRIPNISVNGPGKLDACFGEVPIVSYNAGSCVHYRMDTFSATHVANQLRAGSKVADSDRLSLLYRIIRHVKAFRTGGLIFIVPSEEACAGILDIKYRIPSRFLFAGEDQPAFTGLSRDKEISVYADLIAKFTAVDGAVVMTKDFDLIGFGAEIIADMSDRKPPAMCFYDYDNTEDKTKHFNDNGMRHRAGYRICESIEGAVSIIFSQDGIIKACTKYGGKVVVYDNVALPLYRKRTAESRVRKGS